MRSLSGRPMAGNSLGGRGFGSDVGQRAGGKGVLGPELIVNGSFAADTNWTKGTGFTISGGALVATAVAAFVNSSQAFGVTLETGVTYTVVFDVATYTSGGIGVSFGGGSNVNGSTRTSAGTFSQNLVAAAGNNFIRIGASAAGFTGTIDNVSVRKKL